MGAPLEVTVYFDKELDLKTTKQLPAGSTVADLKAELAADDPTGQATAQDFALIPAAPDDRGSAPAFHDHQLLAELPPEMAIGSANSTGAQEEPPAGDPAWQEQGRGAGAWPEAAEVGWPSDQQAWTEPCQYRVLQSELFKKPGGDPATGKVVKLTRKVGTSVNTTGRTWTGPQGGEWVQLDASAGKPGWLLVEGRGFGAAGPVLERIDAGEEPRMVLRVARPVLAAAMDNSNVEIREFVARPSTTVREAKAAIAALFSLDGKQLIVSRPKDRSDESSAGNIDNTGAESLLLDDETLGTAGYTHGDDVPYIYTGRL